MSKENQNKKNDGQNRCRRCDRSLSDPNDVYGWRCAQIMGLDRDKQIVSALDENAIEVYNRYIVDYLYKDDQTPVNNVVISYNDQKPTNQGTAGILNTGYERANTYGYWQGDKERIADLAAALRVTDTNITDVIVMNNKQGAINNGHNAVLLMNSSGQGFCFSYSSANGYIDDIGEMRFSILNADEVNEVKDRSREVYESVTIYGDRR